jgi:hypothetical protein
MKIRTLLSLVSVLALSAQMNGQAALSLQGTLQKSTGLTVEDGEYKLTFKLYTTESGGTPVWTETQDEVEVVGGVYSVILGSVTPLTAAFDQPYYLGITIGTGAEATPRARLTSSPYALSLIGQSNTFPSSGPVGLGTATPAAGVGLHLKSAQAAKLLVQSPGFEIKFDSTNVTAMKIQADGVLEFANPDFRFPSDKTFRISDSGGNLFLMNSVAGANFFTNLIVFGTSNQYFTGATYYNPTYNYAAATLQIQNVAIWAGGYIASTSGLIISSDRRIKQDVKVSGKSDDLDILLRLRVVDYRMKDEVAHGPGQRKGFIAQEVSELLPLAVNKNKGVVPDIYSLSERIELKGEEMTIEVKEKHGLDIGDKVRLISEQSKAEELFEVSSVNGENSFTVSGWTAGPTDKVFVYGREVDDFLSVDYDYIHTLNVSATQELARRVLELEAQNASLLQDKAEMKQQMDGLGQRLAKLENLATGSAQR